MYKSPEVVTLQFVTNCTMLKSYLQEILIKLGKVMKYQDKTMLSVFLRALTGCYGIQNYVNKTHSFHLMYT